MSSLFRVISHFLPNINKIADLARNILCFCKLAYRKLVNFLLPELHETNLEFPEVVLLQKFLFMGYLTLLVPFKMVGVSPKRGSYKLECWWLQKTLSTVVVVLCAIHHLWNCEFLLKHQTHKTFSPGTFIQVAWLFEYFFPVAIFITFWAKKKYFVQLLHDSGCENWRSLTGNKLYFFARCPTSKKSVSWEIAALALVPVSVILFNIIYYGYSEYLHSTWDNVTCSGIHNFVRYLFIDRILAADNILCSVSRNGTFIPVPTLTLVRNGTFLQGKSLFLHFTLPFHYFSFLYFSPLLEHFIQTFCLLGALITYSSCRRFSEGIKVAYMNFLDVLERGEEESVNQIAALVDECCARFQHIYHFLQSLNAVWWPILVVYMVYIVWASPRIISGLFLFHHYPTTGQVVGAFVHSIYLMVIIAAAAEGNAKIEEFYKWLSNVYRKLDRVTLHKDHLKIDPRIRNATLSLTILHRQLATEKFGLKGYKYFTVTHGFAGTVLGLLATYFIVILQLYMDQDKLPCFEFIQDNLTISGYDALLPPNNLCECGGDASNFSSFQYDVTYQSY